MQQQTLTRTEPRSGLRCTSTGRLDESGATSSPATRERVHSCLAMSPRVAQAIARDGLRPPHWARVSTGPARRSGRPCAVFSRRRQTANLLASLATGRTMRSGYSPCKTAASDLSQWVNGRRWVRVGRADVGSGLRLRQPSGAASGWPHQPYGRRRPVQPLSTNGSLPGERFG